MAKMDQFTDRISRKKKICDAIVCYPDFPKTGVHFRDIFPMLRNPALFQDVVDIFVEEVKVKWPETEIVVGLESRGFLFAPQMALQLGISFVPIRKAGKLPGDKHSISYDLEYGSSKMELSKDSVKAGQKAIIVDDLLATGGTLEGAIKLLKMAKGDVLACVVLMELEGLKGRSKFTHPVFSIIQG